MINLLPPELKSEIRAGQTNVLLLRYCITTIFLALLLAVAIVGVYYIISTTKSRAEESVQQGNAKIAQHQSTQKQFDEFASNLAIAKSILSKDVRYSKISVKIAQALPKNIVLDSLELDAGNFGSATVLNARGKSYNDALLLKESLEKSPLFDDVHFVSVNRSAESDGNSQSYPFSIAISVIIRPEVAKNEP